MNNLNITMAIDSALNSNESILIHRKTSLSSGTSVEYFIILINKHVMLLSPDYLCQLTISIVGMEAAKAVVIETAPVLIQNSKVSVFTIRDASKYFTS
jgi:hypothetical protein